MWQNRCSAGIAGLTPDQTTLAYFNNQRYGDFYPHNGWMISNSLLRNYRRNPISLVGDLSIYHNQVKMTLYDTNDGWHVNRIYHFKNLNLVDIGFGAEIEGKYIFADIQYRLGYLWGGKTDDTAQNQPEIVRNGRLNLNSNINQGMLLGLGLRFKGFHIRVNATVPFDHFQVQMYKNWECSVVPRSLTVGYTWILNKK
jgi:hypothetical protein